jgi:hypothetical protein
VSQFCFEGRSPVYQFGDAATDMIIEDLFYAVRIHAFVTHQCLELMFQ